MSENASAEYVIGPDGERVTLDDLPLPGTRRWVPRRKARVVAAVEGGLLTESEAFDRYGISAEEYASWRRALVSHGVRGLCVTRLNTFREVPDEDR